MALQSNSSSMGGSIEAGRGRLSTQHYLPAFDLPPVDTVRWVVRQKAKVVAAVQHGVISLDEACRRYNLTVEEFLSWQKRLDETPNWQKKYLNN